MLMRSALLGGVAALGASAVLVIPEMEPKVHTIENGFVNVHPVVLKNARHAALELPCNECPFRETSEEGVVSWTEGKPSQLSLDFTIEDNRLLANGRQIYPGPALPFPILAVQKDKDGKVSTPIPVGYALEIMPVAASPDDPGYELLDIRLTILDLETHPVPADTIAITVLQDPNGELFIARTELEQTSLASDQKSWNECHGKAKCLQELLVARIQGLFAGAKARVMGMAKSGRKTCHGKHKGDTPTHSGQHLSHGHHEEGIEEMFLPFPPLGTDGSQPEFAPVGHRPHGYGFGSARPHHHQHHSAFARTFSRIVHFIVIPAVLGVLAGLTVSAVGMLVGQAVVSLWQRYRSTSSAEHKAAWENGDECEKQGLMEVPRTSDDAVPEYIEHPQVEASFNKH